MRCFMKYTFVIVDKNNKEIKKTHNMKIALNAYREGYFVKIYTPIKVAKDGKTIIKQLLTSQWSDGREFVGVEA